MIDFETITVVRDRQRPQRGGLSAKWFLTGTHNIISCYGMVHSIVAPPVWYNSVNTSMYHVLIPMDVFSHVCT